MVEEVRPRTQIFVRHVPKEVDQEEFESFFSEISPVRHAVVVRDPETKESRGFGFVSFATPEDAQTALIELPKKHLRNNKLQAEFSRPRQRQSENSNDPEALTKKEHRRPRLIVRNCPWSLRDPNELRKIFAKYGKVLDVIIPRGSNNRMTGFAFVTMRKKTQAKNAIDGCKNLEIHGRKVAVDYALEKSKWTQMKDGKISSSQDDIERDLSSDSESDSESEAASADADSGSDVEGSGNTAPTGADVSMDEESLSDNDISEAEENLSLSSNEPEATKDDASDSEKKKSRRTRMSNENTVFIRNVPYNATGESLAKHFEQFGPVAYALPVMDKKLNQPKGTAFVAFKSKAVASQCVASAPQIMSTSILIPDDVDRRYVYEGRILSVTQAVDRERADVLTEKRAAERLEAQGKAPKEGDRRRLFLLNEGRIGPDSKLAEVISPADMKLREQSFQLRKQQLSKNPSLHLSMTRLAIRNIPRSMDEKALKALGRKAVVEFATEVKDGRRQPLSKEELMRSIHHQDTLDENLKDKKHGVVRQAKIIMELKGSGSAGRSRGYGFLEMRNHKAALMALRWLNAHAVTKEEIGVSTEQSDEEDFRKRRLVVEFAIENAQVIKRQREKQIRQKEASRVAKQRALEKAEVQEQKDSESQADADALSGQKRKRAFIGRKRKAKKIKQNN